MSHFTSYSDVPSHSSMPPTPASATGPSGAMPQYSQYPPPFMHGGPALAYGHPPAPPQYMFTSLPQSPHHAMGVAQQQQQQQQQHPSYGGQALPAIPSMAGSGMPDHMATYSRPIADPTGQIPPCGARPRITATYWEDENCTCYQVEANGICVARRGDSNMINGTKLLNVAGMTRGRRDGILKSEKLRHVVKVGPMHLKGVWIPFERALEFANKEAITDLLFPLFRQDLRSIVKTNDTNTTTGTNTRRQSDPRHPANLPISTTSHGSISAQQNVSVSTNSAVLSSASSVPLTPHGQLSNRTSGGRTHPLPSPPESASSVSVSQPNMNGAVSYDWNTPNPSISGASSTPTVSFDSQLTSGRSIPTTPAATPPGGSLSHSMHALHQQTQAYDTPRQTYIPGVDSGSYPSRYIVPLSTMDSGKRLTLGSPIRQLDNNPSALDGGIKHDMLLPSSENSPLVAGPMDGNNSTHDMSAGATHVPTYDGAGSLSYTGYRSVPAAPSQFHPDHSSHVSHAIAPPSCGSVGRDRNDTRAGISSQQVSAHWGPSAYTTGPHVISSAPLPTTSYSSVGSLYSSLRDTPRTVSSSDLYSTQVDHTHPTSASALKRGRDSDDDALELSDAVKRRKVVRHDGVENVNTVTDSTTSPYDKARPVAPVGRILAAPRRR